MKRLILVLIFAIALVSCKEETNNSQIADLIVTNAKVAVMDNNRTITEAIAVKDGKVLATGSKEQISKFKNENTKVLDAKGKTLIPGLNDSHLHLTRGGRFFNAELRWDGVKSLKTALKMLKEQAQRTPEGQWVRVIGGWSPFSLKKNVFQHQKK